MTCEVPGCSNYADTMYEVDPNKPKRVCSPCQGNHSPLTLDTVLGVRQKDYGLENDAAAAQKERNK